MSTSLSFSLSTDDIDLAASALLPVAWMMDSDEMVGTDFVLRRSELCTKRPVCLAPSARASDVAPPATEMLSHVAKATGEAFDLHEPPLYQLPLSAACSLGLDDVWFLLDEAVSCRYKCPSGLDWLSWSVEGDG